MARRRYDPLTTQAAGGGSMTCQHGATTGCTFGCHELPAPARLPSELPPVTCHRCGDTREECNAKLVCVTGKASQDHVDDDGNLWTWLPQVGGYASPCRVAAACHDGETFSGFDVDVYHDGDFPQSDVVTTLHFCSTDQLADFAKLVAVFLAGQGNPYGT